MPLHRGVELFYDHSSESSAVVGGQGFAAAVLGRHARAAGGIHRVVRLTFVADIPSCGKNYNPSTDSESFENIGGF